MKYQYDRGFKFSFNEDKWEGYLLTEEEIVELDASVPDGDGTLDGNKNEGLILFENKCLFINEEHLTKATIGHELWHLVTESVCVGSADLTVDQFEEVVADYIGYNLEKFTKKRNMIYRKFKQLEDNK